MDYSRIYFLFYFSPILLLNPSVSDVHVAQWFCKLVLRGDLFQYFSCVLCFCYLICCLTCYKVRHKSGTVLKIKNKNPPTTICSQTLQRILYYWPQYISSYHNKSVALTFYELFDVN